MNNKASLPMAIERGEVERLLFTADTVGSIAPVMQVKVTPETLIELCRTWLAVQDARWISVSERLPDKNGAYLCALVGQERAMEVIFENGDWFWVVADYGTPAYPNVTYWRTVPRVPVGGEG